MLDIPILAKDALREGSYKKNYRFKVLDDNGDVDFTIDNDNLVSESVSFDERMASGTTIKFGLCEGTSLEFQYFGKDNIYGRRIYAEVDVYYPENGSLSSVTIPMGYFTVDACSRQASTGIIKVTAYNKLKSDYLDAKANDIIKQTFEDGVAGCDTGIDISILLEILLNDYQIESDYLKVDKPGYLLFETGGSNYLRIILLQNQTHANNYVIMVQYCGYIRQYPTQSYIPEDHYYREPDWYYTGYLKWWAKTKLIYEIMLSYCYSWRSHLDDTYKIYSGRGTSYLAEVGTLRELLQGTHHIDRDADYFTFSAEMIAGQGSVRSAKISITPENYNKEEDYSPIIKGLKTPAATGDWYDGSAVRFKMPALIKEVYSTTPLTLESIFLDDHLTSAEIQTAKTKFINYFAEMSYGLYDFKDNLLQIQRRTSPVSGFEISYNDVDNLPDVTLRELQSALFEVVCQFGRLDRVTDLFAGRELNRSRLYPADTLYPLDTLYPNGGEQASFRSMYSKLWADEGNIQKFRNLIITYKGLDENDQEKEYKLQRQVNADGTQDYNCSDNWVFKNMVWTAQQIADYADIMVGKMQGLTWFPFEMWCAGLPHLETGDEIEIILGEDTYISYVLTRTLKGIQNLQDTFINGTLDIF